MVKRKRGVFEYLDYDDEDYDDVDDEEKPKIAA